MVSLYMFLVRDFLDPVFAALLSGILWWSLQRKEHSNGSNALMDHQSLTKMWLLKIPLLCSSSSLMTPTSLFYTLPFFFLKFLGGFLVLVAQGKGLKAGTIISKNTEWGIGVPGVRVNIKLSSYVNLFEEKKGIFCTGSFLWLCQAWSYFFS